MPRSFLIAAGVLASALGCNDVSSPTPPAEPQSPAFSASVERFTEPYFNILVDESQGLVAVLGLGDEQLPGLCGGQEVTFDQLFDVAVNRPDGSIKLTARGSVRLTVYSLDGITDLCQLIDATPLATGTAQFNHTDNDFFVSLNRTNSFGETLVGVASGSGGRFLVHAGFRITISRDGVGQLRSASFTIKPLGR
jgi:hypothetical protein